MEVTCIKKSVFVELVSRIDCLARILRKKEHIKRKDLEEWLDSQEVCHILNVGKRTLQYYRNRRILPYSKIDGKIYYRAEDVEKLIQSSYQPLKA